MIQHTVEEKIARISDILEQIQELNELIEFQVTHQADQSTIRQYESMRKLFVNELSDLLKEFKLDFPSFEIAA